MENTFPFGLFVYLFALYRTFVHPVCDYYSLVCSGFIFVSIIDTFPED